MKYKCLKIQELFENLKILKKVEVFKDCGTFEKFKILTSISVLRFKELFENLKILKKAQVFKDQGTF